MRFLATLLLALSLATCGATIMALAQDGDVLRARMEDLNGWLRLHTDYKSRSLPKVVIRTEEEMARIYFGANFQPNLTGIIRALAMEGVVILPPDLKLDGSDDHVILHELVHFQQFEAGKGEDCVGLREREAYELQNKFVESSGRGTKSDPFTVMMMAAACNGAF